MESMDYEKKVCSLKVFEELGKLTEVENPDFYLSNYVVDIEKTVIK